MHPTPIFRHDDTDDALAFIAAHPFAMLAVNGSNGPVCALVPLVLDRSGDYLLGHVARHNPFWRAAQDSSAPVIAVFRGADAYISPSSYPSKQEHGRVVPTWNYLALEVRGSIDVETKASAMQPYITALTQVMEAKQDGPWKVTDAPPDYINKLSHGIVGFRLLIDEISYVRKLSQNKSNQDRQGVIKTLQNSNKTYERAIATQMEKDN